MKKSSVTVFTRTTICVYGKEIRMHRVNQNLSLAMICEQMVKKGWAYYPSKLFRMEKQKIIALENNEMLDLLSCLKVPFKVK